MKICSRCLVEKILNDFNKNKLNLDGLCRYCRDCQKEIDREHYLKNRPTILKRKKKELKKRYYINKTVVENIKQAPCIDCHKCYLPCQMQFDHIRDKKIDVACMLGNYKIETILEEIAKCELVCANCHSLRTYNRRNKNKPS